MADLGLDVLREALEGIRTSTYTVGKDGICWHQQAAAMALGVEVPDWGHWAEDDERFNKNFAIAQTRIQELEGAIREALLWAYSFEDVPDLQHQALVDVRVALGIVLYPDDPLRGGREAVESLAEPMTPTEEPTHA